jgi:hypothetical protein
MAKNKKTTFTLKQLFSIIDGRLSTSMDDVYTILNIATGQNLTTIALVGAMDEVALRKPKWYRDASVDLDMIKGDIGNNFETLMNHLDGVKNTYKIRKLTTMK